MNRTDRFIVYGLQGLAVMAIFLSSMVLAAEIREVQRQVGLLQGEAPAASVIPLPTTASALGAAQTPGAALDIRATGVRLADHETQIDLQVRGTGAVDPLFDLPVLVCEDATLSVTGESLETARQALLTLITQGQATSTLIFAGTLEATTGCWLVLNAEQTPDNPIAPRLEVPVPTLPPESLEEAVP